MFATLFLLVSVNNLSLVIRSVSLLKIGFSCFTLGVISFILTNNSIWSLNTDCLVYTWRVSPLDVEAPMPAYFVICTLYQLIFLLLDWSEFVLGMGQVRFSICMCDSFFSVFVEITMFSSLRLWSDTYTYKVLPFLQKYLLGSWADVSQTKSNSISSDS